MANFNYGGYPYGMPYQPFNSQPQQNQQQNYNNMQQPNFFQNSQQQSSNFAFVNGVEGAKSFQLQPNQNILLMDSDDPIVYMKTTNSMGQATLRYFKLVETNENELKGGNSKPQNEYVLKSDYEALNKRVDNLFDKIEKAFKTSQNKQNTKE